MLNKRGLKAATPEDQSATTVCLRCGPNPHGPFEKLASAPPISASEGGEKITPHRYVPHDLKEIPDCVKCHKPHPVPRTVGDRAALPKPNVNFCFTCHHKQNFMRCKACH